MKDAHHIPQTTHLILIDGSSYLFRAYYAVGPLANRAGKPSGAIYGVMNMLKKLLKEAQTPYISVVFDPKGPTLRNQWYPDYKSNRTQLPEDLAEQIQPLHAMIRALGLSLIVKEGIEADDVIATLTHQAKMLGWTVQIITGDKDMAQLVDTQVSLLNTMTQKILDRQAVFEKFGVFPESIVDYLTLMGDSADHIPGIPKVGPKTAAQWIQRYGSVERIVQEAAHFTGQTGVNLRAHLHFFPLARQLLTLKTDVSDLPETYDLKRQAPDLAALRAWYTEYEFTSWLSDCVVSDPVRDFRKVCAVRTPEDLDHLCRILSQVRIFALDTETTSLDTRSAVLVGLAVSCTPHSGFYIPIRHREQGPQLPIEQVWRALTPFLNDPQYTVVGHNLKYDLQILKNEGISIRAIQEDTMMASYVLHTDAQVRSLDDLALAHFNYRTVRFEDIAGRGPDQKTFDELSIEVAAPYAAEDATVTYALRHLLMPQLSNQLVHIFRDLEMPLVSILADMEYRGVLIDAAVLNRQSHALQEQIEACANRIFAYTGRSFNLNSPQQMQHVLFEECGLPKKFKTKKGQASTSERVLQALALEHPVAALIVNHRSLSKLKSTYTDALPIQISAHTGRIHTSFNQAITVTGRLSSSQPNLHNIPIRTPLGRAIRQAFVAPPGFQLLCADYSQIELRILAHCAQDPNLLDAFARGVDVHRHTASELFQCDYEAVNDAQRRQAKIINFALLYGMSAFGLSHSLQVERAVAEDYITRYFTRYSVLKRYRDTMSQKALECGYVESLWGRRIAVDKPRTLSNRQAAERFAINAPIQATAADVIKKAMIAVDAVLRAAQTDAALIIQVHDELIVEVPTHHVSCLAPLIQAAMESVADWSVPLTVHMGLGSNWADAKPT